MNLALRLLAWVVLVPLLIEDWLCGWPGMRAIARQQLSEPRTETECDDEGVWW
jgi:hypothetical protein